MNTRKAFRHSPEMIKAVAWETMQTRFPESVKSVIELLIDEQPYPRKWQFKKIDRIMAEHITKAKET